jgi:hypothetical protein
VDHRYVGPAAERALVVARRHTAIVVRSRFYTTLTAANDAEVSQSVAVLPADPQTPRPLSDFAHHVTNYRVGHLVPVSGGGLTADRQPPTDLASSSQPRDSRASIPAQGVSLRLRPRSLT